ncbi:MAG: DUF3226 domain-containing protein [Candidatus Methylumidiphilus sp.]
MRKYGYLVVEGPHDVEFVYRLLRPLGLRRKRKVDEVDASIARLIPKEYPPDGDLQKRMSTPLFLQSNTHAIAIQNATGDSQLTLKLEEAVAMLGLSGIVLSSLGILLDSDTKTLAASRYFDIRQDMKKMGFALPEKPGDVALGPPRIGAFVLPDNASAGTLEDLLLDSANVVYPNLLDSAISHIDTALTNPDLLPVDLEDFNKPAGRKKAIIGAMASILKPGKAVQVSIQDNRWLKDKKALELPRIKSVQAFLKTLFELP